MDKSGKVMPERHLCAQRYTLDQIPYPLYKQPSLKPIDSDKTEPRTIGVRTGHFLLLWQALKLADSDHSKVTNCSYKIRIILIRGLKILTP
jgi:hypothetical protein